MSFVIIRPGDLDVVDPSGSKVYAFDWDTDNLAALATILTHSYKITGLNAVGAALNLAVVSFTMLADVVTVVTASAHGYGSSDWITIAQAAPAPYNDTFFITVTNPTTFTFVLGGAPAITSTTGMTATKGLDQISILTSAPYNSRWSQFRFTPPPGSLGGLFEIEDRIVTSETPLQVKPKSFRILVQNQ